MISTALNRYWKQQEIATSEMTIYAMGLGPAFTVLFLYYFYLIAPNCSNKIYFAGIFLIYIYIAYLGYPVVKDSFLKIKRTPKTNIITFIGLE